LIILALMVILFSLVWIYSKRIKQEQNQFNQSLQDLRKTFISGGSLSTSDLVKKFETLDEEKLHRTASEEALLQLNLGAGYLTNKTSSGINILKGLAENEANSNDVRAQALFFLAEFYDFYPDNSIAKQQIFTGNLFSQFIKDDPENIAKAFKNLDEYANKLEANPNSSYRIARWYSEELINNPNLALSDKNSYISQAQNYLKKGDEALKTANFYTSYDIYASLLRAQTFQNLLSLGLENVSSDYVESFYKQPLVVEDSGKTDSRSPMFTAYDRFYYAAFLAKIDKDKRAEDIKNILNPLYETSIRNYLVFKFLKLARDDSNNPYHNDIAGLSAIDPGFKSLMDQL